MHNTLTNKELTTLIRLAKKALWSDLATRKKIQAQRVNIVPANFYADIPLVEDVIGSFEYREHGAEIYNSNIFDKDKIQQFMSNLATYADEFSPPLEGDLEQPKSFFWKNPAFSYSDAMSYYCVVRHYKPAHVLEIGSGYSTLVAHEALTKNGSGTITLIEPYPKKFLRKLSLVSHIIESFVQNIPPAELIQLVESADIWFIDSTHTVKVGSDCLYIYLKIMPEIKKNIIVHTHDIFLPYGLPQKKVLEKHIYWTEQYLLYAYMLDNPKIEVIFSSAYAQGVMPEQLQKFMVGKYPGGGSIWYKLNAGQ